MPSRRLNPVYKAINRPLTILGAERRLFFLALAMGAGTFNLFGTLAGGLLMFVVLWILAQWATQNDPEMLRILLNSGRLRNIYDPMKLSPTGVRRSTHA